MSQSTLAVLGSLFIKAIKVDTDVGFNEFLDTIAKPEFYYNHDYFVFHFLLSLMWVLFWSMQLWGLQMDFSLHSDLLFCKGMKYYTVCIVDNRGPFC